MFRDIRPEGAMRTSFHSRSDQIARFFAHILSSTARQPRAPLPPLHARQVDVMHNARSSGGRLRAHSSPFPTIVSHRQGTPTAR